MPSARSRLGARGEDIATAYLEAQGLRIVARNVRTRYGELDIVAADGATLAFVEVRTRRGTSFGTPEESLTPRKRQRLAELASAYVQEHELAERDWRIDVVAIRFDGGAADIRHYRGIDVEGG